jgi:hypothetical protein
VNRHDEALEQLRSANPIPGLEHVDADEFVLSRSHFEERRLAMKTRAPTPRDLSLTRPEGPLGMARWGRAAAIAAIAAVVVLVTIGGVALFARTGGEEITPAGPPAAMSLLEGTWERSVIESLDPLVHFVAVELGTTEFGLVAAAGTEGVWISEDGSEWHQALAVPNEPATVSPDTTTASMTTPPTPGLVQTHVSLVTEYEGVLYAAGSTATGIDTPEMESRLLIWRSVDGRRWDAITLQSAPGGSAANPTAVVAGDDALLVYASDGAVYRSEDGATWTRFDANATGSAFIEFGDGYVAVSESPAGETVVSHSYTSPDGITWSRVPESKFPTGHHPYGPLTEFDGALYVGGMIFTAEEDGVGAVWRSTDGRNWVQVDLEVTAPLGTSGDESLPAMYEVGDLIVTPHGMLVIGHAPGEAGNHQDIVVLATEDGISFEPVPDPDGLFADAVHTSGTFFDGRVVMVGHALYSEPGDAPAFLWDWTP